MGSRQQMPQSMDIISGEKLVAAIAGAVLSSLYGVFLAHFIALPLGQAIKRKALRDETVRADLLEWAAILIENRRDADPAIAMRTAA